jgi:hypothetical protein
MKKTFALLLLTCIVFNSQAQNVTRFVGASAFQDSLWVIDTTSLQINRRIGPVMPGFTLTGMTGIARNQNSGSIFTISKVSGVTGRVLGKFNLQNGEVSQVGNLGDNFSSITFRGDTLFGVTGSGASVPETVYIIDTVTAAKTLFRALGNGADGEVICYNPTDDMIYHWSGNGTVVFEKFSPIDPLAPVVNIPIMGATSGETFGSVYIGNNKFNGANINSTFNKWNVDGTVSAQIGSMPDDIRGMALITCERQITGVPAYCAGDSTLLTFQGHAYSYQWSLDGTDIAGAANSFIYASQPGNYAVRISDACGDNATLLAVAVVENSLPVVSLSGATEYCAGESVTLSSGSINSNQWYLDGVSLPNETASSVVATQPGLYNMLETDANGCADSSAVGIIVVENALPVVSLSLTNSTYCEGANAETVTISPIGGTLTGTGINSGNFDPTLAGPGSFDLTYEFTDAQGCMNSDMITINVIALPVVSLSLSNSTYCSYANAEAVTTSPIGGILSGTGINNGNFDPALAGPGSFDLTYEFTDAQGCVNSDMITVNVTTAVNITFDPTTPALMCNYNPAITLSANPTGGVFSGNGVSGVTFDPSNALVGANTVYYNYSDTDGCSFLDSITIEVDLCLSIIEEDNFSWNVYPNPANSELNISLPNSFEVSNVQVINVFGQIIQPEMKGKTTLLISELPEGVYIVEVTVNDNSKHYKTVVVKR